MQHRLEFCSEDKVKSLQRFGEPLNKDMAEAFTQYLEGEGHLTSSDLYDKKWGKPFATIFKHVAKCIWPNAHKRTVFKDIAKDRHLYGIRMKAGVQQRRCHTATISPDKTPTKCTKHNTDDQRDPFATPSPSSSEHSQIPRICSKRREPDTTHRNRMSIKRRKHGGFTPHYDILHNDHKYVVRVFLPLMKERTAQLLEVKVNLALRTLKIVGNYFPGHLVGKKASQEIKLQQPLIPIIYAPQSCHGNFEMVIRLPSDIKDNVPTIQSIHDCWGLIYVFTRRKITRETTIDLTTCFGNARLTTMNSTKSTRRSIENKDTTQPQINMDTPPHTQQPTTKDNNGEDWKFTADPDCLIGLPVTLPGERWSQLFKGRAYLGFITSFKQDQKDGYYYFSVVFDDCVETFYLDELLKEKVITTEQYELLKPQCNPTSQAD